MPVITRSLSMGVNDEVKDYFSKLIEPLATKETINTLFEQFENKVLSELQNRIEQQDVKIEKLESMILMKQNTIDNLIIKCDDNEQYSRRSCVRINGIELKENEKVEDVLDEVEKCCSSMGIPYDSSNIDRAHRIGKVYTDKNNKNKKMKSIIVKFKSWNYRTKFYKSRPRIYENGKKKPGSKPFTVSLDLTKRRYDLLQYATGAIEHYPEVKFAFADANCSIGIELIDMSFRYFNTQSQLK